MTDEIPTREFIEIIHGTLDSLVKTFKTSPSVGRQRATNMLCYEFIDLVTENEAYQLGFRDYYDERKGQ